MKPSESEIRRVKESFLRALVLSIVMAILTNTLSLFWAIGGEAWFEDSYFYSNPPLPDSDEKRHQSQVNVSASERGEPTPTIIKESDLGFQQKKEESKEDRDFLFIENIFQYIVQSIKEFFQSIIESFS